jgi:H-type lectin domain
MEPNPEDQLLEGPVIIQTGDRSVVLTGSTVDRNEPITFRKPFNKPPMVFVALTGLRTDKDHDLNFTLAATHTTERGFNLKVTAPPGSGRSGSPALNPITARFIAIGT